MKIPLEIPGRGFIRRVVFLYCSFSQNLSVCHTGYVGVLLDVSDRELFS